MKGTHDTLTLLMVPIRTIDYYLFVVDLEVGDLDAKRPRAALPLHTGSTGRGVGDLGEEVVDG